MSLVLKTNMLTSTLQEKRVWWDSNPRCIFKYTILFKRITLSHSATYKRFNEILGVGLEPTLFAFKKQRLTFQPPLIFLVGLEPTSVLL